MLGGVLPTGVVVRVIVHTPSPLRKKNAVQSSLACAGSARNLGITAAGSEFIWFVDADCVPGRDALSRLLLAFEDEQVAAVGGSYGNMHPESLLATLIQEEIAARHARMGRRTDFLATFNVVYRRRVLLALGGFDENLKKGQDAQLAFRVQQRG